MLAVMDVAILGPLEVRVDGRALPLAGRKQRALLAMLALHANESVSRDRLIEALWASVLAGRYGTCPAERPLQAVPPDGPYEQQLEPVTTPIPTGGKESNSASPDVPPLRLGKANTEYGL